MDGVYYMAPDHTTAVDAGTGLIEFSPEEKFRETVEVGERNLAELEDVPEYTHGSDKS